MRGYIEREEWHPIQVCPPLSIEERVNILEDRMAHVWDEVWWLSLSPWRRWVYRLLGYPAPIRRFYVELWRGEEIGDYGY